MNWLATFTDLPTGIQRLTRNLLNLDFLPAFFLFFAFFVLLMPFSYALWTFDLQPTWDWLSVVRPGPEDINGQLAGAMQALGTELGSGGKSSVGSMLGGAAWSEELYTLRLWASVALWLAALAPTLIECAFPRAARGIPAIAVALKLCIAFDFITDWPAVWAAINSITWFDQFGALAIIVRFIFAVLMTFFVSLGLQVVVALLVVGMLVLFLGMARGGNPGTHLDVRRDYR